MTVVEIHRGSGPLVLGLPHTGTEIEPDIFSALTSQGQKLTDTDWHIHQLYDGLVPDVTTVRATFHRYVIDANRDPSGQSLYPGQYTTGLCPTTTFDDLPIYIKGQTPSLDEIAHRQRQYHQRELHWN